MLGLTFNHLGDVAKARGHLEAFLLTETPDQRRSFILTTGFDRRSEARVILGENLWLQGLARQALNAAELGVQEAREVGHDLAICEALLWAGFTMHLAGVDVGQVRRLAEEMAQRSKRRSFDSHHALAIALQGLCALRTDRRPEGLAMLDDALARLDRSRYGPFDPFLIGEAASAMSMNGSGAQALSRIDDFLAVNRNKSMWCLPELLRRRAQVLEACATASDSTMAEEQYRTALAEARAASMAAWELRIAVDLSGLLRRRGNVVEGRSLVAAALAQFTEGWEFDDLRRAQHAIQQ